MTGALAVDLAHRVTIMMEKTPELKAAVDRIMDVFAGADGGGAFYEFALFVEEMGLKAEAGDEAARQIVLAVTRFDRLLTVIPAYFAGRKNAKA